MLLLKESKKAVLISVVFLTIGFITIGSSYIVGERLFSSSLSLKNKINITVFFKNNAETSDIEKTIKEVKVIDGVSGVSAIDKNQAKTNFLKLFPQYSSLVNSLEQNPFPYTAKVTISNLDMGENIKNLIESFPTVDSVIFSTDTAKKINNLTHMLWFLFTFIFIAVLAEFIFISQSITSLLIDLRHSDIKILELIGADRTFIHMPFLIVISVSALLSWIVSIFALNKIDMWSIGVVKSLLPFAEYSMSINTVALYGYLLIFGILISWIGAVIPLRRIR
jgi:cell division protein FtsX